MDARRHCPRLEIVVFEHLYSGDSLVVSGNGPLGKRRRVTETASAVALIQAILSQTDQAARRIKACFAVVCEDLVAYLDGAGRGNASRRLAAFCIPPHVGFWRIIWGICINSKPRRRHAAVVDAADDRVDARGAVGV